MISLDCVLQKISRESNPTRQIKVGGRLHDSAVGAIYFAKFSEDNSDVPLILKTIDLQTQNLWCITKNNTRSTIRGIPSSNILFLTESKSEAKEWMSLWCTSDVYSKDRAGALCGKLCWAVESVARDKATNLYRVNEYLNESLVGLLLTEQIQLPHIVKTHDAWIKEATGFVLQDYGGTSMYKSMVDLSLAQFKSIVLQVLITLSICQEVCAFKHHDVHLENVFLTNLTSKHIDRGLPMNSKATWCYELATSSGPLLFAIQHHNKLAKLGDFGLSSITDVKTSSRVERADYSILDAGESEWGEWSGRLECMWPYDALTFLSKFFMDTERSLCHETHSAWARNLYKEMQTLMPTVECSVIGRPLRGREGNLKIADLLAKCPSLKEYHYQNHNLDDALYIYKL